MKKISFITIIAGIAVITGMGFYKGHHVNSSPLLLKNVEALAGGESDKDGYRLRTVACGSYAF